MEVTATSVRLTLTVTGFVFQTTQPHCVRKTKIEFCLSLTSFVVRIPSSPPWRESWARVQKNYPSRIVGWFCVTLAVTRFRICVRRVLVCLIFKMIPTISKVLENTSRERYTCFKRFTRHLNMHTLIKKLALVVLGLLLIMLSLLCFILWRTKTTQKTSSEVVISCPVVNDQLNIIETQIFSLEKLVPVETNVAYNFLRNKTGLLLKKNFISHGVLKDENGEKIKLQTENTGAHIFDPFFVGVLLNVTGLNVSLKPAYYFSSEITYEFQEVNKEITYLTSDSTWSFLTTEKCEYNCGNQKPQQKIVLIDPATPYAQMITVPEIIPPLKTILAREDLEIDYSKDPITTLFFSLTETEEKLATYVINNKTWKEISKNQLLIQNQSNNVDIGNLAERGEKVRSFIEKHGCFAMSEQHENLPSSMTVFVPHFLQGSSHGLFDDSFGSLDLYFYTTDKFTVGSWENIAPLKK